MLKSFKLYDMADRVGQLDVRSTTACQQALPVIGALPEGDNVEPEARSIIYPMNAAEFSA